MDALSDIALAGPSAAERGQDSRGCADAPAHHEPGSQAFSACVRTALRLRQSGWRDLLRAAGAGAAGMIEPARDRDLPEVRKLLEQCKLPLEGVDNHVRTMLVARDGAQIVGTAALELYPDGALLRSVAVEPSRQGSGLGREMTHA